MGSGRCEECGGSFGGTHLSVCWRGGFNDDVDVVTIEASGRCYGCGARGACACAKCPGCSAAYGPAGLVDHRPGCSEAAAERIARTMHALPSEVFRTRTALLANQAGEGSRDGFPHLTAESDRETLIQWLQTNDPNGSYTDDACDAEGFDPIDLPTAWDLVCNVVVDVTGQHPAVDADWCPGDADAQDRNDALMLAAGRPKAVR